MSNSMFKIVFKGEIGFDYDQDEVKSNLQRQCGFSKEVVERLFSGGSYILKKDIDEETGFRYRDMLQRLGALCEIVPMAPPPPEEIPKPPEIPKVESPRAHTHASFHCPACGKGQASGDSCVACGVVFAKFERAQQRRTQESFAHFAAAESRYHSPALEQHGAAASSDDAQQGAWVRMAGLFVGMAVLQTLLANGLTVLGFILLPVGLVLFVLYRVMASGESLEEIVEALVAVLPPADKRPGAIRPYATYAIVLLDLLIYYLLLPFLDPQLVLDFLVFLPAERNVWSLTVSTIASLFLHVDSWQLWGSMLLLWVVGSAVERRIGTLRFVSLFLLGGILANILSALAHALILSASLHAVGSSAAIAALFGVFAACCHYRHMVSEIPLLGVASLYAPRLPRLGVNALLLLGVFVYANLSGADDVQRPLLSALVGHLMHLGGFTAGAFFGMFLDPEQLADASGEDRVQPVRQMHNQPG